jgi:thiamine-monophosphate kinase
MAERPIEPRMGAGEEFALIGRFRDRLAELAPPPPGTALRAGIGEDAAIAVPGGATATSVDALVDGVHFRSSWCPPRAVGRKALAAALSDLAAVGAGPGEAYVWLGRPDSLAAEGCLEIAEGLGEVAAATGTTLAGGDLTASPVLALTATVVGHAERPEDFVGRAGMRAGDALCVTGELGGAAAGLLVLEHPELREQAGERAAQAAVVRQLDPVPRLALGRALAAAGASAMIDLSDGLGGDAGHLASASGVGAEIELERLPLAAGVAEIAAAAGHDPRALAASGGEDYELLCALPRPRLAAAEEAVRAAGGTLREVGQAGGLPEVRLRLADGRRLPASGYDALRG